jgi:hypothetical protein
LGFSFGFFVACRLPEFLNSQAGDLRRQGDPLVHQLAEPPIIVQLRSDFGQLFFADKLGCALSMPLDADLMVRPVFDGGRGFAPAAGIAANIILLRESAGT